MNRSKIPVRYAKALFILGKEKNILGSLSKEVSLLADFFHSSPSLLPWLKSPAIKMEAKKDLFKRQFKGQISPLLFTFINLVISKRREMFFPDILRNFLRFHKDEAGIKTLILTTAVEIDENLRQRISLIFSQNKNPAHELITIIKPGIIGGFMLQTNDLLYDASIATELKRLKKELTEHLVGIEID